MKEEEFARFLKEKEAQIRKREEDKKVRQEERVKRMKRADLGDGIIDRDKLKGQFKTEDEKALAQKKKDNYIREYTKSNYSRYTIYLSPVEKNELLVQSEIKEMSISAYIKSLIEKDKANFDKDEYVERLNTILSISEDESNASINKKDSRLRQIKEVKEEAREYFGKNPNLIPKTERCQYINKRLNEDKVGKGLIQIYCEALNVSRAMYYNFLKTIN